jgi:hypothetical protein
VEGEGEGEWNRWTRNDTMRLPASFGPGGFCGSMIGRRGAQNISPRRLNGVAGFPKRLPRCNYRRGCQHNLGQEYEAIQCTRGLPGCGRYKVTLSRMGAAQVPAAKAEQQEPASASKYYQLARYLCCVVHGPRHKPQGRRACSKTTKALESCCFDRVAQSPSTKIRRRSVQGTVLCVAK